MDLHGYIQSLKTNTNELLHVLDSVDSVLLTKKPENGWSVFQIAEHIYLADKVFIKKVFAPSENRAATNENLGNQRLEKLLVEKRSLKVKAPDFLEPRGFFSSKEQFKIAFIQQRDKFEKTLTDSGIVPDNQTHPHPFFGELTQIDWMYNLIHHAKRHIEQMKDTILAL